MLVLHVTFWRCLHLYMTKSTSVYIAEHPVQTPKTQIDRVSAQRKLEYRR